MIHNYNSTSGALGNGSFSGYTYVQGGTTPISGASISYTGPSTGSIVSNASGSYASPSLAAGTYTITVSYPSGYMAVPPTSYTVVVSSGNSVVPAFYATATSCTTDSEDWASGVNWGVTSLGHSWHHQQLTGNWVSVDPANSQVSIVGGRGRQTTGSGLPNGFASVVSDIATSYPTDLDIYVDCIPQYSRSVEAYSAVSFRAQTRFLYDWRLMAGYELRIYGLAGAPVELRKLRLDTSDILVSGTGFNSWAAGDTIHIRILCSGPSINIKLWTNTNPEPSTWNVTATDTEFNGDGFALGVGTGSPGGQGNAGSVDCDWDNLSITYNCGGTSPNGSLLAPKAAGTPGHLVSSTYQYTMGNGANVYNIVYNMSAIDGGPLTQATAWVAVPPGAAPSNGWPMIAAGHGATGLGDSSAPNDNWSTGDIDAAIGAGFMVVNINMEGLGDPVGDRHPYLVKLSSARSMIDGLRAAAAVAPARDRAAFWGFSAGGCASLFAGEVVQSYAPEFSSTCVVSLDPVVFPEWMYNPGNLGNWGTSFTVGQIYGLWVANPSLDTGLVLSAPYNTAGGMAGLDNSTFNEGWALIANPATTGGGWSAALVANTHGNTLSSPVRLRTAQSGINSNWSTYLSRASSSGTIVDYSNDPGVHDSAFVLSQHPGALAWVVSTLGV